jgi:hypothetical protein
MTIDRALSGKPFDIDQFRCREAADVVTSFRPGARSGPWSHLSPRAQFVFKSLFISICHQINWDYLQTALAGWLLPDPEGRLDELAITRSSDIARLLAGYSKPERIKSKQRAEMLRRTAKEMRDLLRVGRLEALLSEAKLEGPGGFYDVMGGISAFAEDDVEKKVRVLAHDLFREGIIVFKDPQHLRPAIEYHIIRLYVRTGRVCPTHQSIREHLRLRDVVARGRYVRLLRKAVEEAMELTAFYAKLDIATLNHLEWQIGRAICTSLRPSCSTAPPADLPSDIALLCPQRCLFAVFCPSYNEPREGWFYEPQVQKAIY